MNALRLVLLVASTLGVARGALAEESADPPVAAAPASAEEVFLANQDGLVQAFEFLKSFDAARETDASCQMAADVPKMLELAGATVAALEAAIPNARRFEGENAAAKELQLGFKLNQIKSVLPGKAQKKLEGLVSDLDRMTKDDVEWLGQKDVATSAAATILERIQRNVATLESIAPQSPLTAEAKALLPKAQSAYDKVQQRVAKNRMPKGQYGGDDQAALAQTMAKLYGERFPDSSVKRVVIVSSDWVERAQARVDNDGRIEAGVYRHLYAHIAAQKGKKLQVYSVGFRKTWDRREKRFGPVELHSFGESYPILPENLAK